MIRIVRFMLASPRSRSAAWTAVGLVLLLAGPAPTYGQVGRWTAHTAMREVLALSASEDAIWAATTGGVFRYVPASGEIERFTAAEGLHNVQTRAVAYDARRGAVWIGYRDGALDRLDVASGDVRTFFDIARNDRFTAREINRLVVRGDSLLVATEFGLVVFDPIKNEVRAAYVQLGELAPETPVRDVTVAPLPDGRNGFWLATREGVAYAPFDSPNLQDPGAWTVERSGLPSRNAYSIAFFQDQIYVGTAIGLIQRQADGSYFLFDSTDRTIVDLTPLDDRLLAVDDFKLYAAFSFGGSSVLAGGFLTLTAVVEGPGGNVWVGGREEGLNHFARPSGNGLPELLAGGIYPDGPFDGIFGDLTVDADGVLWAAAVEGAPNAGFYRLGSEGNWTTFSRRFIPELEGRGNFRAVHAGAGGSLWASSFGSGLAQVTPGGEVVVYDERNSTLGPSSGFAGFYIVGGAATDADGTLWVTNTTASVPLHVRTPDGQWTGLPAPSCTGFSSTSPLGDVFIDSFGQKWITVLELGNLQRTRGLLLLDTGRTPTDPSDDACRFLNQRGSLGQGLPSTDINGLSEDREGRVWIATSEGPAFVFSSSVLARDPSSVPIWPQWADLSQGRYVLGGLKVNDIAVDPANRLWLTTDLGVFLVQQTAGGFEQVARFDARSTPLFSDVVVAAAVDDRTGEVYFATDQGLISFRGDAIAPATARRDLFVYPNPVRIVGETAPEIFIEGLVEETRVQVLAPHGEVVAQFDARGGRVRWDGRDRSRELVPSGVYLIVAVGQNGEGTAFGKVAVIR